jgi:quercetin dioxygenase-like cupin family protein
MNKQRRAMGALKILAVACGLAMISAGSPVAEERRDKISGIEWTVLQQAPLAAMPAKDEVMGIAEIAPGTAADRHTHAEPEFGYMLQGELVLEVEGEAPRKIRVGDSFAIGAGKAHHARNGGDGPAKVLVIYIVDRGGPLAMPAK